MSASGVFQNAEKRERPTEAERLRALNKELVEALQFAASIIGHPDDVGSKYIASIIAKAKEEK